MDPAEPAGGSRGVVPPHVIIARLGRPHGLEGFLGIYIADEELARVQPGSEVSVGDQPHTVRALRQGKKGPQVAFEGVTDRTSAEGLRGLDVSVAGLRTLGDDEYWPHDLVGLEVRPGGGTVVAVESGVAQDRLVIEREGSRFEVPFVSELVPLVDVRGGFVEIVEIEGLSQQ